MELRGDYSGAFDPELTLADFSRSFLSRLGREYLLLGHLLDRIGQPLVAFEAGAEGYKRSAIEEWMGASPVYSKRMQRLMNFEGDDVGTVFKNMQLEIGMPQQFMDAQYRLDSPEYGEFWLAHCGALLDVEPHGERGVQMMCHDIEDPTFDATAAATNSRMTMRPIHRPPRIDGPLGNGSERWPHCRWAVAIADDHQPYEQHPNMAIVARSSLASIPVEVPAADGEAGGWPDYSGELDSGMQLEDFSHRALVGLVQEFAVQAHLLVRSYLLSQTEHFGVEKAAEFGRRLWIGHAALGASRLQHHLGIDGDDAETMAKVLQLHPNLQPRTYLDLRVDVADERTVRISIGDCPALHEGDALTWFDQLGPEPHPALTALVQQVNPRAALRPVADVDEATYAWDAVIDPAAEPAPDPEELEIARISKGTRFRFEQRRNVRV